MQKKPLCHPPAAPRRVQPQWKTKTSIPGWARSLLGFIPSLRGHILGLRVPGMDRTASAVFSARGPWAWDPAWKSWPLPPPFENPVRAPEIGWSSTRLYLSFDLRSRTTSENYFWQQPQAHATSFLSRSFSPSPRTEIIFLLCPPVSKDGKKDDLRGPTWAVSCVMSGVVEPCCVSTSVMHLGNQDSDSLTHRIGMIHNIRQLNSRTLNHSQRWRGAIWGHCHYKTNECCPREWLPHTRWVVQQPTFRPAEWFLVILPQRILKFLLVQVHMCLLRWMDNYGMYIYANCKFRITEVRHQPVKSNTINFLR